MNKFYPILAILLVFIASFVAADINSDIDYYFNMDYPDTTNRVDNASIGSYSSVSNYANGVIGNASYFGLTYNNYALANFNITPNPWSYSIWIKRNGDSTNGIFWDKAGVDYQYRYSYSSGNITVQIYRFSPSAHCRFRLPASLDDNIWHNIIIVKRNELCNQSSFKIYVDSVMFDNFTYQNNALTNQTFFDKQTASWKIGSAGSLAFKVGEIDEVGIWLNYEITQSDANTIYNGGLANGYPYPECVANWSCNGYGECIDNNQSCISVTDLNLCGGSYSGNYSEFPPQNCSIPPGYHPTYTAGNLPDTIVDFLGSGLSKGKDYIPLLLLGSVIGLASVVSVATIKTFRRSK